MLRPGQPASHNVARFGITTRLLAAFEISALRLSLLAATRGLGLDDVQIESRPERRGSTAARGQ